MIPVTREVIYKELYLYLKEEFLNSSKWFLLYNKQLTFDDNASRLANMFAVQHTENVYKLIQKTDFVGVANYIDSQIAIFERPKD